MHGTDILKHPRHLGRGAPAVIEPAFTGNLDWYQDYTARHALDGAEGRLVSMFTFAAPWHTADVAGPATALFITAGLGTRHRPR